MDWLENACEKIDAGVFSSDMLYFKEQREMLKHYMARWQRAIEGHGDKNHDDGDEPD